MESLFDIIVGPADTVLEGNLPKITEVKTESGTIKILGPYNYTKLVVSAKHNTKLELELALSYVGLADNRVITGSFCDGSYFMISGQARRATIPLQPITDAIDTVKSVSKLIKLDEVKFVTVDNGMIHCLIGLNGELDVESHTFPLSELVTFLDGEFKVTEHQIFAINPEYVKYDDLCRYRESAASLTFKATPENVAKIIEWGAMTGQLRIGFEFGNKFTNIEF